MRAAPEAGVNWTPGDFVFAIVMFSAVGLVLELVVRSTTSWTYRVGVALALAAAFLLVWANLAVGYIGSEDNPYNLVFLGVIAIAAAGALLARFRPAGMARAMTAAAIAHAVAGAIGYPADPITGPITAGFTAMWLASAFHFHRAARQAKSFVRQGTHLHPSG